MTQFVINIFRRSKCGVLKPRQLKGCTYTLQQAKNILFLDKNITALAKDIAYEMKVLYKPKDFEVTKNEDNNMLTIVFDNGKNYMEYQYTIVPIK